MILIPEKLIQHEKPNFVFNSRNIHLPNLHTIGGLSKITLNPVDNSVENTKDNSIYCILQEYTNKKKKVNEIFLSRIRKHSFRLPAIIHRSNPRKINLRITKYPLQQSSVKSIDTSASTFYKELASLRVHSKIMPIRCTSKIKEEQNGKIIIQLPEPLRIV